MKITDQEGRAAVRRVLEACLTAGVKITTSVPPQETDDDIKVWSYIDQLTMERDAAVKGHLTGILRDVGPNDIIVIHTLEGTSMYSMESIYKSVRELQNKWGVRFLVLPPMAQISTEPMKAQTEWTEEKPHVDRVVED